MIELNCLGQRCPLPVIALAKVMADAPAGETVRVLADDPAAAADIPAWCRMRGQEYLGSPATNTYEVRKGLTVTAASSP
ncbi:MAG TPA: aminotransferase [Micromonosporaceae bacterium]|nr:aminotransferase [Micromonosporaceae bacterium]